MENYDLDVDALEGLCSTLEEPAFLMDENYNIVWANGVFKNRYDVPMGTNYSQLSKYEIHHPSTMDCLELGKLIKAVIKKDEYTIKLISLPIKYGDKTVSVLQLIEYMDILQDNTSILVDNHTAILKLFIGQNNDPVLLTDKHSVAITFNEKFDKEFSKTPEIKELMLKQLEYKNAQEVYDNMQRIMLHSHNVSRKILEEGGHTIGYMYFFRPKSVGAAVKNSSAKSAAGQKQRHRR